MLNQILETVDETTTVDQNNNEIIYARIKKVLQIQIFKH